jgi:hypothetical protein
VEVIRIVRLYDPMVPTFNCAESKQSHPGNSGRHFSDVTSRAHTGARIGIGSAFIPNAPILILDEPHRLVRQRI